MVTWKEVTEFKRKKLHLKLPIENSNLEPVSTSKK